MSSVNIMMSVKTLQSIFIDGLCVFLSEMFLLKQFLCVACWQAAVDQISQYFLMLFTVILMNH